MEFICWRVYVKNWKLLVYLSVIEFYFGDSFCEASTREEYFFKAVLECSVGRKFLFLLICCFEPVPIPDDYVRNAVKFIYGLKGVRKGMIISMSPFWFWLQYGLDFLLVLLVILQYGSIIFLIPKCPLFMERPADWVGGLAGSRKVEFLFIII